MSHDAGSELAYIETRKSPSFKRPADKVNDTSIFPDKKRDTFDQMQYQLDQSQVPTDLDYLLANRLGEYVDSLIEKDPYTGGLSKMTAERA